MSVNNTFKNFNWGLNGADSGHQYKMDDELRSLMIAHSQLEINSKIDLPSGNNITKLLADPAKARSKGIVRVSINVLPFKVGETSAGVSLLGDLRYYFGYYQPVFQKEGDRTGNYTGSFVLTKPGVKLTNEQIIQPILNTLSGLNRYVRETLVDEENNRYKASLTESELPSVQFQNQLQDLDHRFENNRNNDPLLVQQLGKELPFDYPANTPLVIDASQDLNSIARVIAIVINSDIFYQFREVYFALDQEAVASFGGKVLNIVAFNTLLLSKSFNFTKRNIFSLGKELGQTRQNYEAKLVNLQQQAQAELKNTEEKFNAEKVKLNNDLVNAQNQITNLSNDKSNLIADKDNLKKELEEVSQELNAQLKINEKEKEKLNVISLGLGTQLQNLKQAFEQKNYTEAEKYLVDFEANDPVKSLLVSFKPYYETLQNKAKDLSSKESTLKNESARLKQEQAEFQANKATYKQAIEVQDILIREKVISNNEPKDTLNIKLREALKPKGNGAVTSLVGVLFFLIGVLVLGISFYFITPVKKLFLSPDELAKLEAPEPPKSKL
ncbi:hypothetical protein, partial [Psittacicella gerlachiana]